jgi:lysophospholipase L1-like esterase
MIKKILITNCLILMSLILNAQEMKVKITNAGYNGNNTADLLARYEKDVLAKKPELVIMMIGTNDMLNLRNILTLEQYEANYQELINTIKKNSKLILMTIPPIDNESLTNRIGSNLHGLGPKARVDAANEVIKRLAKKNKCKLIDLHLVLTACGGATGDKESIFQNLANGFAIDGVHPTKSGYLIIGATVYQAIANFEPDVKSIVCFGDSITFGFKMTGQGTVKGDSYPAVLNRMLNPNPSGHDEKK